MWSNIYCNSTEQIQSLASTESHVAHALGFKHLESQDQNRPAEGNRQLCCERKEAPWFYKMEALDWEWEPGRGCLVLRKSTPRCVPCHVWGWEAEASDSHEQWTSSNCCHPTAPVPHSSILLLSSPSLSLRCIIRPPSPSPFLHSTHCPSFLLVRYSALLICP